MYMYTVKSSILQQIDLLPNQQVQEEEEKSRSKRVSKWEKRDNHTKTLLHTASVQYTQQLMKR